MGFEDDGSLRVDFTDVEGQKEFEPIPPSKQKVIVSDWNAGVCSDNSKNPGEPKLNISYTVMEDEKGDDKYQGRMIWDTFVIVPNSLWKLKAFLSAIGEETEGELNVTPEEYVGRELVLKLGIQRARKDKDTGEEYAARNQVKGYYPAEDSDMP